MSAGQIRSRRTPRASPDVAAWWTRLRAALPVRAAFRVRMDTWVVLAAGLVLAGALAAIVGASAVQRSEDSKARLAFRASTDEIAATLKLAIQQEEDLIVAASAFVTSGRHITPANFDRWVESVHALQRYPELQNIGLVKLVPAGELAAFQARVAADPVRPFGAHAPPALEGPGVVPPIKAPFYCLAVAGLARDAASYVPTRLNYCALAPQMMSDRDTALANYAPVIAASAPTLGVSTPVYRGGVAPRTVGARRRAFVGWLGELIVPNIVLRRALEGHPSIAVRFLYQSPTSHVSFSHGSIRGDVESTTVHVHHGWTLQAFAPAPSELFGNRNALAVLVGGLAMSLMFGLLVLVLGTGRTRALALVREKTGELSHQALHDALTGLPNRALALDRAKQLIARAARSPSGLVGALFIDVDGFKHVNDHLGHAAGDQLLKAVGQRLTGAIRDEDTVGRLGGDEFVVLVDAPDGKDALDGLANRITKALREPIELEDGRKIFSVTASIGVTVGKYEQPDDLLRDADLALYAAKAAGKDRYALFDVSMYTEVEDRLELEGGLSTAVQQRQFFLLYQPIFDLRSGEVVDAEALIRWNHPTRGILSPDGFIPLAEESGLIVAIGRWVLNQACRQAQIWRAEGMRTGVSVNVSAYQLGRKDFIDDLRRALDDSGIDPAALTLEVTETTVVRDLATACRQLEAARALGVRIAIDDFGTGLTSLSNLQRIPADVLKIDKSFAASLRDDGPSHQLLHAVLGLGQALSLEIVVEGIEEQAQLDSLAGMGCNLGQGFLLAEPGPPEEIEDMLRSGANVRTSVAHA
jgi:diguanylate cyclase (GGDEF)-like protein